ncbi:MAG: hypothetical protein Q8J64_08510 [Thermodesulfovibrionales bacterium]|nr:hypothetical protein [Thermodesulfovibrionales bacterium]
MNAPGLEITGKKINPGLLRLSIFLVLLTLASCGKKESPRLVIYEKPETPAKLNAVHREQEIRLGWSYPGNRDIIEGFQVMRAEDNGDFRKAASTKQNIYIDKGIKIGLTYRYKVIAKSIKGVLGDASAELSASPVQPPPAPEGISLSIGTDSLTVSWSHREKGALFNVYRGTEKGTYPPTPANDAPLSGTSFSDGLDTRRNIYYTVRALRGGPLLDEGPQSAELAATPDDFIPSAPEGIMAVATEKNILLMWKENPQIWVRGYRIYRALGDGEFNEIAGTETPAYLDKEQFPGLRRYKVAAMGPAKEGPISDEVRVQKPALPVSLTNSPEGRP